MLSGDNGLLKRAGDARDDTVVGQEKEQVELAYISAAVKKLGNNVDKDDLQDELDISVGDEKTEVTSNTDDTLNVKFIVTEHNYNVNNGFVSKVEPINYPLASEILQDNYTANTDEEKSSYVNYTDSNEDIILCRVLYNDESGIDIISSDIIKDEDTVVTVTLGYNDPTVTVDDFAYTGSATMNDNTKKAAASYNRSFITLNEVAENYRNKTDGIAESARCVGSPKGTTINTLDSSGMYSNTSYAFMSNNNWNGIFKDTDTNYQTDYNKMSNLGIIGASSKYWIASRFANNNSWQAVFGIRYYINNSGVRNNILLQCTYSGGSYSYNPNNYNDCGFRPIFHLAYDTKVIGGTGTESDPYILGK